MQYNKLALYLFFSSLLMAFYIGQQVEPIWQEQQYIYPTYNNEQGDLVYKINQNEFLLGEIVDYQYSPLRQEALTSHGKADIGQQWVKMPDNSLLMLKASFHYGF